ncbi:MAG: response regulator [Bacteroidales bacterium]|nr:response regulator [Bacteroidales bacterium]
MKSTENHYENQKIGDIALNILAVDDQPDNLFLIKTYLKKTDVRLTTVSNGYDAIKIAQQEKFDFILMDIKMPDINGVETSVRIKSDSRCIESKIIALTASTTNDDILLSADMFDDVLFKPLTKEELYSKLSISLEA